MLGLAERKIEPTPSVRAHLDLCLDCRGCETACPSGVVYHELLEETRGRLAATERKSSQDRFMRRLFFHVFVHPTRLKLALLPARILQKLGIYGLFRRSGLTRVLPPRLRKMEQLLPPTGRLWPATLPPQVVAAGKATRTVGFFPGCVGSVLADDVNRMAVELLAAAGANVVIPPTQTCCGAIHHHNGAHHPAAEMARRNIDAFLPDTRPPAVDFIATNIAGCGAMLREYDFLLRDDARYAARSRDFVRKTRDITEVLLDLGLESRLKHAVNETVTYHDACHLAHAQKVTAAPRKLLAAVPGLRLVPLPESDMCCGAAGTYNLQHPEMATQLADRKLRNIASTAAPLLAAGNVGCAMHLAAAARERNQPLRVVHPVELLHRSVFGPR
jgi:glycolate oxidase iron-sulfur subunit